MKHEAEKLERVNVPCRQGSYFCTIPYDTWLLKFIVTSHKPETWKQRMYILLLLFFTEPYSFNKSKDKLIQHIIPSYAIHYANTQIMSCNIKNIKVFIGRLSMWRRINWRSCFCICVGTILQNCTINTMFGICFLSRKSI